MGALVAVAIAVPAIALAGSTNYISQPVSGQTNQMLFEPVSTNSAEYVPVPGFTDIVVSNTGPATLNVSADMRKGTALLRVVAEDGAMSPIGVIPPAVRFSAPGSNSFTFAMQGAHETYTLEWRRVGKGKVVAANVNALSIGQPDT